MLKNPTEIGFIYANIAGDHRYATKICVMVDGADCEVEIHENGAVGGMDGSGDSYPFQLRKSFVCQANPKDILKTVKSALNTEVGNIVKRYGKPSKRFSWVGATARGLNVKLVGEALAVIRG